MARRDYLTRGGTAVALGLSGCIGTPIPPSEAEPPTDPSTATPTTEPPTEESSPTPDDTPALYRVDLTPVNAEHDDHRMFQYETAHEWDDHEVDLDYLTTWHDNDYREFGEPAFVDRIPQDSIVNREPATVYPNYDKPATPDRGDWDFNAFDQADTVEEKYRWVGRAWLNYAYYELGGISSTQQFTLAPTIEEVFERYTEFDVHAWGFNAPVIDEAGGNHGSDCLYDQTTDQLYLVDPAPKTAQLIATPSASNYNPANGHRVTDDVWHPLWYRGEVPDTPALDYDRAKEATVAMLRGVVSQDFEVPEEHPSRTSTITDQYLEGAVAQLADGTLSRRLRDQLKVMSDLAVDQYDTETRVLLYGTVDDPRYAVGSGSDMDALLDDVTQTEATVTIEDVEAALSAA